MLLDLIVKNNEQAILIYGRDRTVVESLNIFLVENNCKFTNMDGQKMNER